MDANRWKREGQGCDTDVIHSMANDGHKTQIATQMKSLLQMQSAICKNHMINLIFNIETMSSMFDKLLL